MGYIGNSVVGVEHPSKSALNATTGTFTGAFTSLGIDDNADATAITIDSSETVMIGKTSEAIGTAGAEFRASGHQLNMTRASGPALNVNRLTDDGDLLGFYQDSSLIGTIGTNGDRLYFTTANRGFYVDESGSEIVPSNGSGGNTNNIMNLGNSASAFKDLYLGGNLYIGGTGSANALDDYEEGTYTPALASTSATFSYSVQQGTYVKIGQLVYLQFNITLNANPSGTTSNVVFIDNVPFNTHDVDDSLYGGGHIGHYFNINLSAGTTMVYQTPINSTNQLELKEVGDNIGENSIVASELQNGSVIRGSIMYRSA